MMLSTRGLRCLAVAVLLAACGSGRAMSDASATGHGGATGSAGSSGAGGGEAGGATGSAGNSGTGGGAGMVGNGGASGGGGTDSADAGTTPCGCAAGQVCVRTVIGGASYVCPDAGLVTFPPNCDGRFLDANGCCFGSETSLYSCAARPSGCGATVTCACAKSTLCMFGTCSELGTSEIACLTAGP